VAESKKRPFVAATLAVQRRGSLAQAGSVPGPFFGTGAWLPPVDVYETSTEFIVMIEIGGVSPDDLDLVLQGQVLHISGVRSALVEDEVLGEAVQCIHHREIDHGAFDREILLPCPVDSSRAFARFLQGLVRIHIAKAEAAPRSEPRSIKVD
jgi:HSP20 family protein